MYAYRGNELKIERGTVYQTAEWLYTHDFLNVNEYEHIQRNGKKGYFEVTGLRYGVDTFLIDDNGKRISHKKRKEHHKQQLIQNGQLKALMDLFDIIKKKTEKGLFLNLETLFSHDAIQERMQTIGLSEAVARQTIDWFRRLTHTTERYCFSNPCTLEYKTEPCLAVAQKAPHYPFFHPDIHLLFHLLGVPIAIQIVPYVNRYGERNKQATGYTTNFFYVDVDVDAQQLPEETRYVTNRVRERLRAYGTTHVSKSGAKGYHVEMYLEQPVPLTWMESILDWLKEDDELSHLLEQLSETHDKKYAIEIRPYKMQASKLPLTYHHKTGTFAGYVNESFELMDDSFAYLHQIAFDTPVAWLEAIANRVQSSAIAKPASPPTTEDEALTKSLEVDEGHTVKRSLSQPLAPKSNGEANAKTSATQTLRGIDHEEMWTAIQHGKRYRRESRHDSLFLMIRYLKTIGEDMSTIEAVMQDWIMQYAKQNEVRNIHAYEQELHYLLDYAKPFYEPVRNMEANQDEWEALLTQLIQPPLKTAHLRVLLGLWQQALRFGRNTFNVSYRYLANGLHVSTATVQRAKEEAIACGRLTEKQGIYKAKTDKKKTMNTYQLHVSIPQTLAIANSVLLDTDTLADEYRFQRWLLTHFEQRLYEWMGGDINAKKRLQTWKRDSLKK